MARKSLGHVKANVFFEPTVLQALKWLAGVRGTSYSELTRVATKEYVIREITKEKQDIVTLASVVDREPT